MLRCLPFLHLVAYTPVVFLAVPMLCAAELLIEADRNSLYEGEQIAYRITVVSDTPIPETTLPDLKSTDAYHVQYHGRQDQNQQSFSSFNGRKTQSIRYVARFTYEIQPLKTGRVEIPAPNLSIDGTPLTGGRVRLGGQLRPAGSGSRDGAILLNVRPQDQQDIVSLKIEASRPSAYPLQPFEITLVLQVKGNLPGDYAGKNPLGILVEPPQLRIPWVEDAGLPPGLRPSSNRDVWLSQLQTGRDGLQINDLVQRSAFPTDDFFGGSPFGSSRSKPLRFSLPSQRIKRPDASGTEVEYWEYRLTRRFIAERIGPLDFGPCTIKGKFAIIDPDAPDRPKVQQIYAIAPAVPVVIRDVPRNDRPTDYIGAFGRFQWNVDLEPRTAQRGQPLTLTLSLLGQGSVGNVAPPDLNAIPEVASHFRVYAKPTSERIDEQGAVFTYTIRPTVSGDIVFPAIPVSYFDVENEQFVSLASEPIPITVSKSEDVIAPPPIGGPRGTDSPLQAGQGGIYANRLDPSGAYLRMPGVPEAITMFLTPFLAWLAIAVGLRYRNRMTSNTALHRRRRCFRRVQSRLIAASHEARDRKQFAATVQGAIAGLAADWANEPEQGVALPEIESIFEEYEVDPPLLERFLDLLETLDTLRFGGNATIPDEKARNPAKLLAEAEELCARLREQWEPDMENTLQDESSGDGRGNDRTNGTPEGNETPVPRRTRSGSPFSGVGLFALLVAVGAFVLLGLPLGCSRFSSSDAATVYADAQRVFDEADALDDHRPLAEDQNRDDDRRREEFEKAARMYEQLSEQGVTNGTLFYNQGNAWARAGNTPKAIASYRRALRFQPRDAYTRLNLAAVAPPNTSLAPTPAPASWIESVFFWQNMLGYRQKYRVTLFAAWGCALFGIASLFVYKKVMRRFAFAAALITLLAGFSFVYDYARFAGTEYAVVAVDAAVARKGNSAQYEPRFTTPLAKGTEAIVVEHRGNWTLLRFADRQEAWLPRKELVVY